MNNKIIDDLIACGVPSDTLIAVVKLIAEAETAEKNRAQARARVQKFRDRERDLKRNVTLHGVTETLRNVTETLHPPAYKSTSSSLFPEERKIKPKKVLSTKTALPADFELSESDKQQAIDRGWTTGKISSELDRFRDHAAAHARKQADWHAAWRMWVNSPYQSTNGGHNGRQQSSSERAYELSQQVRAAERAQGIIRPDDLI